MEQYIQKIAKNTKILINNKAYSIEAKAKYVTEREPDKWYVKVFLDGHYVLVMSPSDNFMYFGKDIGNIGVEKPFEEKIVYNGKEYRLVGQDYQIMINLEFGSPLTTEGEVEFWDYECSTSEMDIISIGDIKRTGKRGDIVAKVISLNEIKLIDKQD